MRAVKIINSVDDWTIQHLRKIYITSGDYNREIELYEEAFGEDATVLYKRQWLAEASMIYYKRNTNGALMLYQQASNTSKDEIVMAILPQGEMINVGIAELRISGIM